MNNCEYCRSRVADDAMYCGQCGAPIAYIDPRYKWLGRLVPDNNETEHSTQVSYSTVVGWNRL